MKTENRRLCFVTLLACLFAPAAVFGAEGQAARDPSPPNPQETGSKGLAWLSDLAEGHRRAAAEGKPVVVLVRADWCPACRRLEAEIEKPEVQKELARWTLVALDITASPESAARLGVAVVPALRVRTPSGRTVASHDGAMESAALADWVAGQYEKAAEKVDDALTSSGPPDAVEVLRLIEQLGQRGAAQREASVRRLAAHPEAAKAAVVKAFAGGNLATRLAAAEVLHQWQAPLTGLDPWLPETVTDERLAALKAWGENAEPVEFAPPEKLTPAQLADARRQIDRMMKGPDASAEAVRERLARFGPALLPEVYERLKGAATDRDRELLAALRYRLVAGDSLVFRWPGGLARLAASDTRERQKAAEELAGLALPEDARLLLELFSDPDPLVREIALRGLQEVGGEGAGESLVGLLDDPEPNVRAAVLKRLAEGPSPALATKVARYIEKEKDADLIVHGIRVLKAVGGVEAVKALMAKLDHPSWQVRAEAAEALGNPGDLGDSSFRGGSRGAVGADLQVEIYVALLRLLDDADAFVVSRAVTALRGADMEVAVEPLVKAAEKHPDLAPEIIAILGRAQRMKLKALPRLRAFTKHPDAALRAAALEGLVQAAGGAMEEEILAGLADPESKVRTTAATAVFQLVQEHRQKARESAVHASMRAYSLERAIADDGGTGPTLSSRLVGALLGGLGMKKTPQEKSEPEGPPGPAAEETPPVGPPDQPEAKPQGEEEGPAEHPEPLWDEWLAGCHEGRNRPKWTARMIEPLEKLLAAQNPEEKLEAAVALTPLGRADKALPALLAAAQGSPERVRRAGEALPWLLWDNRLALFHDLRKLAAERDRKETYASLVGNMAEVKDARAAELFWQLLADPQIDESEADALETGLRRAYLGERYYSASDALPSERRAMAKAARQRVTAGGELQCLAALVLLASADRAQAAEAAASLAADETLSPALRRDAFHVFLVAESRGRADRAAVEALAPPDADRRRLALAHLARGPGRFTQLRGRFSLYVDDDGPSGRVRDGLPIIPEAPPGLKPEHVRPLLKDADPETAAYAGYLLAVLREPEGLGPLLAYWRSQKEDKDEWDRLAYRAIAALDDAGQIAVLRDIRARLNDYEISEFYWTIRIMSGPEVLKLRKEIRDAVGMDRLR